MKKVFHHRKERTVIDIVSFSNQEFIDRLIEDKPKELYCSQWSEKTPFISDIE